MRKYKARWTIEGRWADIFHREDGVATYPMINGGCLTALTLLYPPPGGYGTV